MYLIKRLRGDRGNSQDRQNIADRGLSLELRDADTISANIVTKGLSEIDFQASPRGAPSDKSLADQLSEVNRADWSDSMESL